MTGTGFNVTCIKRGSAPSMEVIQYDYMKVIKNICNYIESLKLNFSYIDYKLYSRVLHYSRRLQYYTPGYKASRENAVFVGS